MRLAAQTRAASTRQTNAAASYREQAIDMFGTAALPSDTPFADFKRREYPGNGEKKVSSTSPLSLALSRGAGVLVELHRRHPQAAPVCVRRVPDRDPRGSGIRPIVWNAQTQRRGRAPAPAPALPRTEAWERSRRPAAAQWSSALPTQQASGSTSRRSSPRRESAAGPWKAGGGGGAGGARPPVLPLDKDKDEDDALLIDVRRRSL